jgi:hypothetical protein
MRQNCPLSFLLAPRPAARLLLWAAVLSAGGLHPVVGQSEDGELIRNGNFAAGAEHWDFSAEGKEAFAHRFEPVEEGDGQWAVIETKPDSSVGFSRISQPLLRVPGTPIKLSFLAAAEKPEGGNGAYAYVEFLNAGGRRISGLQSDFTPRSGEPVRLTLAGEVPAGTKRAVLRLILHGRGTARFTDVSLVAMDTAERDFAKSATLVVADRPAGGAFFGMGAEDDGWAYTKGNAAKGWSDEDSALREKRLRWLQPSFVRSFIWTEDWLPGSFWQGEDSGYLFDGDLFQSKLRTWQLYKEIGADVMLAQVSWRRDKTWTVPERHIPAIGDLFAHLQGENGLTNVKYYSVYNEPNHSLYAHGGNFEIYTRYHEGLAAEFAKRGLPVGLVGSDDGNGLDWFGRCVETPAIRDHTAFFASHKYIPYPMLNPEAVDGFFDSRLGVLERHGLDQPFLVTEFGFSGGGTSHYKNPYMKEPDYALASMDYVLRGLNRGVRGFCFWTMHEMVYPPYDKERPNSHWNQIMGWALWDYDGTLRPVYHAAALMMREMRPGMPVYPVKSDAPGTVQATRVGDKIFWVNLAPHPVEITVEGLQPKRTGIILADDSPADFVEFNRSEDVTLLADGARFTVPGRSYGLAE